MSVPLILLLLVGSLILSHVLKEELVPLQILTDKVNRQTARSLAALDETQVPAEVAPLIRGLNALLSRLRDALDAQRKFIADAAHQLRTPLTAVKLHADRAVEADSLEVARHALRELQTAADRAVRLSNQLLSLARAEPGLSLERLGPVEFSTWPSWPSKPARNGCLRRWPGGSTWALKCCPDRLSPAAPRPSCAATAC